MSWKLFFLLVEAARMTVLLSAASIAIGFLLASLVCAGMLSRNRFASGAGRLFVSFFRGTPLLVQLLLIYYLLPRIGVDVPSWVAAIAGMALCTAAYQAEIMRGGLGAVPTGLVEAADMTGMSGFDTFRRIRLPIAVKLTLPALISEAIMMLKSSSLVSVVGVIELTRMAQDLAASTYRPLELYAAAGFLYLIINLAVAWAGSGLEARMRWGADMSFDLGLILSYGPQILSGLGVTILLWVVGSALGLAVGFGIAVGRRYGPAPLGWLLRGFVELIRGTPFLVQVFLLYYGGPFIGLSLENIPAGILALTIYAAAYYSELWRTGFDAIPKGHLEAADCVGFSRAQTLRRVILPEMTVLVLPAMVNMTILILKETAILSIISLPELTLNVSAIGTQHYAFVESFTVLALIYWGLVELCGALGRRAEARLAKYRFAA